MALDIDKVEAILRKHWQIPSGLSLVDFHNHAGRIHVLVRQKYSHDNLKYQLRLMQMNKLHQDFDDQVCDQIATDLLQLAS